jgi:O-antigen/teichoic acid export membrane protein
MTTALLGLLINLTLSPALAYRFGFAGVLAGTVTAYGVVSLLYLVWTLGIAEFEIPFRRLFRLGGLTILAGSLPGVVLTPALRLGEQGLGWLTLLSAGVIAGGAFVALSLTQADHRRIVFRAFHEVREGIMASWSKRKLSNA